MLDGGRVPSSYSQAVEAVEGNALVSVIPAIDPTDGRPFTRTAILRHPDPEAWDYLLHDDPETRVAFILGFMVGDRQEARRPVPPTRAYSERG